MTNIKAYDFVDCLVVDFAVDKLFSFLEVVVEAYYPLRADSTRDRGLIKIHCLKIGHLDVKINEEFEFDVKLPYPKDTLKANEVYSIEIDEIKAGKIKVVFESDFLNFNLECEIVDILEVQ